jgi:hypothetical protein
MCTSVTLAVPYLLLGLQDVQWAVGNSRGARKLTRTPHVNKKKKTSTNRLQGNLDGCYLLSGPGGGFLYRWMGLINIGTFFRCPTCHFRERVWQRKMFGVI